MSNEKYVAPEMDIIEFGNEDLVCTISGSTTTDIYGNIVPGGPNGPIGPWDGSGDFES